MTSIGDLVAAAGGSPVLLAVVVIGGFAVFAIERLAGVDGPLTRGVRAWQERELRRLRRQRLIEAERRLAVEPDRVAALEAEVLRLREALARARPEQPPDTAPIRRRRPPVG